MALGEGILGDLRETLRRRFSSSHGGDSRELARKLIHTRAKLEQERHEGATGFKSCAGGFFDIDYVIAYSKLSRGLVVGQDDLRSTSAETALAGPELQGPSANSVAQIAFLELRGALDGEQASVLRNAANFYRSLDHAIRLVLGRPSAELPEPAQIPRVTALLEQWGVPISEKLHDAVISTRRMVRGIYEGMLRQDTE
jgi:glutamine synthetase adenylyltransferase